MNGGMFFPSWNQRITKHLVCLSVLGRACFLILCCVAAVCAEVACTSTDGKVAARNHWNGVKMGASVYDARTRDFEKPWPFGTAAGAGGNVN
jgi:hypothetical protein